MESNKPSVSVIVPVFNEGEGISLFLKKLLDVTLAHPEWSFNIVVVDDGSTDSTSEQLREFPQITVLSHRHNRGYGAALKTGISYSDNEFVVIIDADNSYDPDDIFKLLKYIENNDMVVGARRRITDNGELLRRLARWTVCKIANFVTKRKIADINSGLRVINKSLVDKFMYLLPDGFSFTTTITVAMLTESYCVHFEPISHNPRVGCSKIRPAADFSKFLYLMLVTILCFNPIRIFLPTSLFFIGSSLFVLLFSYFYLDKVMDITTVLLFISGMNFLGIGLIAEIMVRLSKRVIKDENIVDKPTQNR